MKSLLSVLAFGVFATVLVCVVRCGGNNPPGPGPSPDPEKNFSVSGKYIDVKGTVKTVSVSEAKAAVSTAVHSLEE